MMGDKPQRPTGLVLGGTALDKLERAIKAAVDYSDMDPLIHQIRQGNPYLTDSPFRDFVADRLAGEPLRGRGEKPQKKIRAANQLLVLLEIAKHVATGAAAYSNGTDKRTACKIASEKFPVSESTAVNIWKARKQIWAEAKGQRLRTLEIPLRCEIYAITGKPPRGTNYLALESEAHMARSISPAENHHAIENKIRQLMGKIFPE